MPNQMPTASKLAGAVVFGCVGATAAWLGIPTLPEEVIPGYLLPVSTGLGIWIGWVIIGRNPGITFAQTITQGIATIVVMVAALLFLVSSWEMIERSMRLYYDGPGEAVLDIARLLVFYGKLLLVSPVLVTLALGATFGALIVRSVGRIWS